MPASGGVEGELADGNAHAAHPRSPMPSDPLAVGDDDDAALRLGASMAGQGPASSTFFW